MSTRNSIVTPRQLRYIAETIEVLFAVQGFTLSFHSLLEIQRACVAAEGFNNRQPVGFPNHLYDIITSPTPDTRLHLTSFAVWNNHANLQAVQMRVPASLELLKEVKLFCDQVLPRHKLENHRTLLKMFADAMFQLESVAEYIRPLPAPSTPQTFPEVQFKKARLPQTMADQDRRMLHSYQSSSAYLADSAVRGKT